MTHTVVLTICVIDVMWVFQEGHGREKLLIYNVHSFIFTRGPTAKVEWRYAMSELEYVPLFLEVLKLHSDLGCPFPTVLYTFEFPSQQTQYRQIILFGAKGEQRPAQMQHK